VRKDVECGAILLDGGVTITARHDECRSTPFGWAARANSPNAVELLLARYSDKSAG
jgi:hypothetical protein